MRRWTSDARGLIAAWLLGIVLQPGVGERFNPDSWNPLTWGEVSWIVAGSFFLGWLIVGELRRL